MSTRARVWRRATQLCVLTAALPLQTHGRHIVSRSRSYAQGGVNGKRCNMFS